VPETRVRVAGSGFSTFNYKGKPLAFLDSFTDSGVDPVAPPEPIHPLGEKHPVEIATARAVTHGTLTVRLRELWNEPVWYQLGLAGADDIVAVYEKLAREPAYVTCQIIIKPPGRSWRGKIYQNCVVTDIDDSESVTIGSLSVPRDITIVYTHTTPLRQAV